jgi:hypothetical protein
MSKVKNLTSICIIISTTILTNVSQATLIENYLDECTESFFNCRDKFNFNECNVSFDGYLNHRKSVENDFDILLRSGYRTFYQEIDAVLLPGKPMPFSLDFNVLELPTRWQSDCSYLPAELFTRRNENDRIVALLLVIENHPTNYFGLNRKITPSRAQISTLARTFNRHSFRYPFESRLENITEGDGTWLQQDLFMPIARLAENRYLRKKPAKPVRQAAKSRPDRLPTPSREQSDYPRDRSEEHAGPILVVSRFTDSKHQPLTHNNGVPGVLIDTPLRYRFPEFYSKPVHYSESARQALRANKRKVLPALALNPNIIQTYVPNLPLGVESWADLRARNGNSGKIYHINKPDHSIIPNVTPVGSGANDWPTAANRILKGQNLLEKLALAG